MHAKGAKQVRESAAVSNCTKISCVRKVGELRIRKLSAYEIFWIYSIQLTQQRYVCVCLLTFFCLLSAEKLLTGDEKHRKKHVVSSLWYTEALQFVRVHACITLKRKCRTNSKHDKQNL